MTMPEHLRTTHGARRSSWARAASQAWRCRHLLLPAFCCNDNENIDNKFGNGNRTHNHVIAIFTFRISHCANSCCFASLVYLSLITAHIFTWWNHKLVRTASRAMPTPYFMPSVTQGAPIFFHLALLSFAWTFDDIFILSLLTIIQ